MSYKDSVNQYNHTPRKVFDKYIDRMAIRRDRDLEDHRGDLLVVFRKIQELHDQLTELSAHVASHCQAIDPLKDDGEEHGNEGLE